MDICPALRLLISPLNLLCNVFDYAVNLGVEGGTSLLVLLDEVEGIEHFLRLVGEAAEVEVVAVVHQLPGGEFAGLVEAVFLNRLALVPPLDDGCEVVQQHGLGLGEMLVALGHIQAVEPGLLGGLGVVEEKDIGGDGGVRCEHASGKAHDGVEVELRDQLLLEGDLGAIRSEEEAVRQDDGGAAIPLEAAEDDGHKEVCGLAAGQICGEVLLDGILFRAAVWRIHENDVKGVSLGVVEQIAGERVVVHHVGGVQAMKQEVGDAEGVGELLLLDAVEGRIERGYIFHSLCLILKHLQP